MKCGKEENDKINRKVKRMTKKKDLIKLDGKVYKKEAFLIEEEHPAIGRIMIVEGQKFKIMDDHMKGPHKEGTFIAKLTEDDEERMEEYDDALELLSEKLAKKVDIKKIVKENLKSRVFQDIKTGLYILDAQEKGEVVTQEEGKGCYQLTLHHKNHSFSFVTGDDVPPLQVGERF